ncbi:MAG: type I-C CRISPR-associated protein Cas8c/Csd1 [Clostridia bacterium]|nr:type I-C CRISPR-associated protein Cas8c/Csd1 [Clostridia bacterium]
MLKALYDYAIAHELSLPDGYAKKTVAAYIAFSSVNPDFVDIYLGGDDPIACPDIGSLANGKDKSNIIVEKRSVVIAEENSAKHDFFWTAMQDFGKVEPDAALCVERMSNSRICQQAVQALDKNKIKATQRISFVVDGRKLPESPQLAGWWALWRKSLFPPKSGEKAPCLITGEMIDPVATVASVKGLQVVGGHASGDSLICFDKAAFCSYGLKQAANAPVSETAVGAVRLALEHLLADAPILCGMKFVHWYDREIPEEENPIRDPNLLARATDDPDEDEDEDEEVTDADRRRAEMQAKRNADRVVKAVQSGRTDTKLDATYYILLLTGVGGRIMVRRFEQGSYEQLRAHITQWNEDLALVNSVGNGDCRPLKLTGRLIRLLKYQKNDRKIFERLGKELAGITPAVLTAVLSGGELPDAVAVRALAYIRSKLLSADDERKDDNLDGWACQWLKVWLLRRKGRRDTMLNEYYNAAHPEAAYHCGAAMAVYAAIQNEAMRDVNVTVVQRYYASCIQTPALVLGRLSQLSVHHIAKLRYPQYFTELLEEVNASMGARIPTVLDLEKQSYFALGYYQMSARIRKETRDRIAEAKNKHAQEEK